jgi:hypothetical protein
MSVSSKAHPMKHVRAWCDKCRADILIIVPREHEPKCCPMCRRKFVVENIRYV